MRLSKNVFAVSQRQQKGIATEVSGLLLGMLNYTERHNVYPGSKGTHCNTSRIAKDIKENLLRHVEGILNQTYVQNSHRGILNQRRAEKSHIIQT